MVSHERHALQKTFQTIPVGDTIERRKKTHFNRRTVSTSLQVISQEFINSYHSFYHMWANDFTIVSLYTWCHVIGWSTSLFPDRMNHKRGFDGERDYLPVPPEARQVSRMWKDYYTCENYILLHSRCKEDQCSKPAQYLKGMGTGKEVWRKTVRINGGTLTG